MSSLANKFIDQLARGTFSQDLVNQVISARDRIHNDMRQQLNLTDQKGITAETLNRGSVTREQLCGWLEAVNTVLDSLTVPLLLNAVSLATQVEQLREEKIADQRTIIELQQTVIGKKEAEVGAQEPNISTQPSSSIMSGSLGALSPDKKIQLQAMMDALILRRAAEGQNRGTEAGFYSVREAQELHDGIMNDRMEELLAHLGDFTFNSSDHVTQVLKRAKSLREEEEEENCS